MSQATAVVLDSDQNRRDDIRIRLSKCGILPICFQDEWICLENIYHVRPAFAVFRPDFRETAIRFINLAKAIQQTFPIIVLSNQNEIENFVRNHWLTNLFYLQYPADEQALQTTIALLSGSESNPKRPVLITGSLESQKRIASLPLFGMSDEPVLIQGEPGVGKRLMARAIHSCAGAGKMGLRFIKAKNISGQWIRRLYQQIEVMSDDEPGAIFHVIENIEALPMELQSQLLLILEDPEEKLSDKRRRQTIRLITLAADDLERLSQEGRFRTDLYHRLSVLKMTVPPLRERQGDVDALTDYFAAKHGLSSRGAILRLPDNAHQVLKTYHWPGNVMELKRFIKRALASDGIDWTEKLTAWRRIQAGTDHYLFTAAAIDMQDDVRRLLENNRELSLKQMKQYYAMQIETRIIKSALSRTNGNRKKAAALLDISYKSMLNKAKAYGLIS